MFILPHLSAALMLQNLSNTGDNCFRVKWVSWQTAQTMQRIPGLLKPQHSLLINFVPMICINHFNYESVYEIERESL